ncbi:uncharacterized protein N7479_000096 [Penicillium vulpinum]|uniref:uncharacterized protein n=1 Tax=Penicillium vulpinum TaxID=29845 RepID=UPI002548CD63|nr:uncharacterized protein N7479_000096 [Penicillium vulpinum]KAJ5970178.1 hypothetical protein N7479_000096 [Penicillium vulpinum]
MQMRRISRQAKPYDDLVKQQTKQNFDAAAAPQFPRASGRDVLGRRGQAWNKTGSNGEGLEVKSHKC